MKPFDYVAPGSIESSVHALRGASAEEARLLAGGTDLLPLMKSHIAAPRLLVSLKRVADLPRDIVLDSDALRIGALATLADIGGHPEIARDFAALAQAAGTAATAQLRNMATLGGTLLQRPRCWYFRNESFHCWLKGGAECHARAGENGLHALFDTGPCRAVHPSDVACALMALDARVELRSARAARSVSLREFFAPPTDERRVETILGAREVVTAVRVPRPAAGFRSIYLKAMDRAVWAFATVSVAAAARVEAGRFEDLRLVLGGVAAVPWPVEDAFRSLQGAQPDEAAIAQAARDALAGAEPLRMNGYKVPLAEGLIRRALHALRS
ncbi:MAG: xanthine dehydrogenase family protein subunit M [Betaproteobacteria bacterium]|nr:xanthine dehydrogenase family protein subunit M [Betaproteobacteria bacterium]